MAESNHFAFHLERYLKTLLQQGKSEHKAVAKGLERKQLGAEIVGVAAVLQLAGADGSHGKRPDI